MFDATDIEGMAANARASSNAAAPHDYDSQTDVESIVQAYMIGNPNWNENVISTVSGMHNA